MWLRNDFGDDQIFFESRHLLSGARVSPRIEQCRPDFAWTDNEALAHEYPIELVVFRFTEIPCVVYRECAPRVRTSMGTPGRIRHNDLTVVGACANPPQASGYYV